LRIVFAEIEIVVTGAMVIRDVSGAVAPGATGTGAIARIVFIFPQCVTGGAGARCLRYKVNLCFIAGGNTNFN